MSKFRALLNEEHNVIVQAEKILATNVPSKENEARLNELRAQICSIRNKINTYPFYHLKGGGKYLH